MIALRAPARNCRHRSAYAASAWCRAGDTRRSFADLQLWRLRVRSSLLALALTIAAILQVAFGLKPMSRLRVALNAIKTGESSRLPRTFPSEIQPLADDLNGMIELNSSNRAARARVQAGNLAHGLKTPLAILADEADRLRRRGRPSRLSPYRAAMSAHAAANRLSYCARTSRGVTIHAWRCRLCGRPLSTIFLEQ